MLTYYLEERGSVPIYQYLYQKIKEDISAGKIQAGEKLPSKRAFAANHKISVVTVENAYSQLCEEGYLYSVEKKGYFVSDLFKQPRTRPLVDRTACYSTPETQAFTSALPSLFPFAKWAQFLRKNITYQFEQMPFSGIYRLKAAISHYLFAFRRMEINPDNIMIGSGSEYLYHLLTFLFPEKTALAIENPGYMKIKKIYTLFHIEVLPIPIDGHGLSVAELNKTNANVVHVSPSHHFPVGVTMPLKRRLELLNWANAQEGRLIIEDEYDTEFQHHTKPLASLQSLDTQEKVIYINTFSKTISPSLRISFMILPNHLLRQLTETVGFYACTVSSLEQNTLAEFMESGCYERHINRLKKQYANQHTELIKALETSAHRNKFEIGDHGSGTGFILRLKTDLSEKDICEQAQKKGIQPVFLSDYYFEKSENCRDIIINDSYLETKTLLKEINGLLEIL